MEIFDILKRIDNKNYSSGNTYQFTNELIYFTKDQMIKTFAKILNKTEDDYYRDAEFNRIVESFTQCFTTYYKMGRALESGKTYQQFENEDKRRNQAIMELINSL